MRTRLMKALGMVVLLLLHVVLVLRVFPWSCGADGEVPFRGDVSRYYATAHAAAATGGFYGYDPYNMAGYPVGLWNSMGKKGYEVLHLLLPAVPLPRLFYGVLAGLSLLTPLLLWGAVRVGTGDRRLSALLVVGALTLWHLDTQVAYFWSFGNVFFPSAAVGLVVMTAAAWAVVTDRRPVLASLGLGLVAAAIFYAHTVVLLAGVAPLLALVFLHGVDKLRPRHVWCLAGAVLLFLVLIVPWLLPLLQSRADCLSQPKAWFQSGPKELIMDLFSDRVYQRPFDRNFLTRAVVVLGVIGTWRAGRRQPLVAALGVGGIVALLITYGASAVPALRAIQPYRFLIPATVLLLAPAMAALQTGIATARAASRGAQGVIAVLTLLLLPAGTAYLIDLAWPRDPAGLNDGQRAVLEHFRATPPAGRLFVDDPELGHLLPSHAGVSVIGGLSTQAFLKHRFAGVDEDHIAFGRHASAWDEQSLRGYLDAYGVEFALLTSRPWQQVAARMPGMFEPAGLVGGRPCYRLRGVSPSLVQEGQAEVTADYQGIHVRNATPGRLVLKLHYAAWLDAGPGVTLHPEPVLEDPVPFIRAEVAEGVSAFTIRKRPRVRP